MPSKPEHSSGEDDTLAWDSTRTAFTQIPDWILFHTDVNDAALRTWLVIASYVDNKTRGAFPKVSTLAAKRSKGRRQIFDHLEQLEAAGLLKRRAQYRPDGRRKHNHYTLAWKQPLNRPTPTDDATPEAVDVAPVTAAKVPGAENRTVLPHDDPGAENRTGIDAENRAGDHAESRAVRTTPTNELDPLTPKADASTAKPPKGATAPLPPRHGSSRPGTRANGTNPRAIRAQDVQHASRHAQMTQWARTMNIPSISLEEFQEMVDGELRSGRISATDAETASNEAQALRQGVDHTSIYNAE